MWQWLRRSFIAGVFVTVPLVVSVVAIVWVFRFADRLTSALGERVSDARAGPRARDDGGDRAARRRDRDEHDWPSTPASATESLLLHVPLFKTVYAPVKQLISAFSPDNEFGFKRMVLVEDAARGFLLGFLTKEFTVDRGRGAETMVAVYVPTNHLYLGDVIVCPLARASFPEMTVEEGIRVFLTGGMGLPDRMRAERAELAAVDG